MRIIKAKYIRNYKVKLFFSDKKSKIVNFADFILGSSNPVFSQYADLKKFKKFKLEFGNIVWGRNWDLIFPLEQLYEGKIKISEKKYSINNIPLSSAAEPRSKYGKR